MNLVAIFNYAKSKISGIHPRYTLLIKPRIIPPVSSPFSACHAGYLRTGLTERVRGSLSTG